MYPTLDDSNDKKAESVLKKLHLNKRMVGVSAREILLGGGNIHCITQSVSKMKESGK